MNKDALDSMIEVIEAFKANKPIQIKMVGGWCDIPSPDFNFSQNEYRIKPVTVRYRRYIYRIDSNHFRVSIANLPQDVEWRDKFSMLEESDSFVRWIDNDWIEEEV